MRDSSEPSRPSDTSDLPPPFAAEAERFREVLATGRSAVFLQLFDFLLARSGDKRAPKEVEVALALFGAEGGRDTLQDSAVRVYVHRLRKRLDEFYSGKTGPRLQILKGEYRIVLAGAHPILPPGKRWAWLDDPARRRAITLAGIFALVLIVNSAAWLLLAPSRSASHSVPASDVPVFWRAMAGRSTPLVVVGDSYVLAETDNQKDIKRLVLEPTIQSRDALGDYLTTHPSAFYKFYDLDLHYTPAATAISAWKVISAIPGLRQGEAASPRMVSSSRLAAQDLESADIIYVGQFANLGILAPPLFNASGFRMGQTAGELIDQSTKHRYQADEGAGQDQQSVLDYGYIASFMGPAGHHVFLIAGLGDVGVKSMADLINDTAELNGLVKRAGSGQSFEALYAVRAMGTILLDRSLIVARPLRSANDWGVRPVRP